MPPGSELREKLRLSTFPPFHHQVRLRLQLPVTLGPWALLKSRLFSMCLQISLVRRPSRVPRPHSVDGAPDRARVRRPSLSSEEGTTHCRITFSRARIIPRTVWSLNIAAVKPGATTGNLASY